MGKFLGINKLNRFCFPESNPRVMLQMRVLIGQCYLKEGEKQIHLGVVDEKTQVPVDTWTDLKKSRFFKLCLNEVYPEKLLIYRDTSPENSGDSHSLRLANYIKKLQISYRSGKRFNPQEVPYQKAAPAKIKSNQDQTDPTRQKVIYST